MVSTKKSYTAVFQPSHISINYTAHTTFNIYPNLFLFLFVSSSQPLMIQQLTSQCNHCVIDDFLFINNTFFFSIINNFLSSLQSSSIALFFSFSSSTTSSLVFTESPFINNALLFLPSTTTSSSL
jgi:hypothetical protein